MRGGRSVHHGDTEATEDRGCPPAGRRRPGKRRSTFGGAQFISKTGRQCVALQRTSTRRAEIFCPTGNLPIGQKKNSLCVLCAWFVWISEYVPLDRGQGSFAVLRRGTEILLMIFGTARCRISLFNFRSAIGGTISVKTQTTASQYLDLRRRSLVKVAHILTNDDLLYKKAYFRYWNNHSKKPGSSPAICLQL